MRTKLQIMPHYQTSKPWVCHALKNVEQLNSQNELTSLCMNHSWPAACVLVTPESINYIQYFYTYFIYMFIDILSHSVPVVSEL